jgi:hypothetical protein
MGTAGLAPARFGQGGTLASAQFGGALRMSAMRASAGSASTSSLSPSRSSSSLPGDGRVPAAAYSERFLGTSWSHPSPPAGAESESGVDAGAVFHWGAMYSPNHPALSKRRFGRKLDGRRSRADDESKLCPLLGRAFMPSICVVPV